ncbi:MULTISPECIES: patatin-like phospholipase family protein [unclassified Agrobacterium]|jgi:NTE family protein|uniref:Patatin n=1 Tax=Agrobacterium fabrum TaxID=1176649 RepID=A0A2W5EYW3_9HYPH|nr:MULTISPECIES: patatin-like phospholipase family protein [unclassified Agrobacterium]PZP49181.1 MAG: Patatin [Agrobacterium fabrum]MDH0613461.1 patatin-like phospholipase family protein [Agrobacterium sp. GD03872]MDH0697378.1 patatin-like phospholipase family protein [Agrobacterium sp. GD03871]MDH1060901.1 patatin-like phospholipase family protein [Agrobacterium sp. GD03992]MDH2211485.1 patatin-like phospholipase family protein [Agrobacterium sp. GD03643]
MLGWGNRHNHLAAGNPEALGNEPPVNQIVDTRRIALALGGGAARGWAHIGVLRALDEAGVKIGMIAGTSIGALVGGCYLAGKLDELEEFARSLTMRRIAGLLDLTIGGGGLFGGMRLTKRMQEHLEGLRVENLDHPFIAVATELRTGHEVWIHQGDLVTALRSSYALPGIFEPVQCNGRTLIDGALVNPVPVSVCRAYEQALVVAVNLNYDLFGRSAVVKHAASPSHGGVAPAVESPPRPGLPGVMVQAFNIIQDRISRSRLAGDPPDLMLHPRINDIGLSEFHRASEAIDRGYEETRSRIPELERMQQAFRR